jgi:hypothetical protein
MGSTITATQIQSKDRPLPSPAPDPRLLSLIRAIESGTILDLTARVSVQGAADRDQRESRAFDNLQGNEIKAEWLKMILSGQPVEAPDKKNGEVIERRRVDLTTAGIHIRGAVIKDELDLSELTWPGGAALPALRFEGCRFEHEQGVGMKRCHFRSLTFKDCELHELQAEEATIDGPVKLRKIRRPKHIELLDRSKKSIESRGTYVVLRGAQIAGHVDCGESSFAAAPRDNEDDPFVPMSRHPRFALDLRATKIWGSVLLRPDVKALGGISVTLAQIQGSIWAQGAELTAIEDAAFSADYSEIRGAVYLRTRDRKQDDNHGESVRFCAKGQVSLFSARIGGSLYMDGADLQNCPSCKEIDGDEPYQSVDLTNATIDGNCQLGRWRSKTTGLTYPFEAAGAINLGEAKIRSDLHMIGARVKEVSAAHVEIGGTCDLSVDSHPLPAAADGKKPQRYRFTANAVKLEGAVIRGDLQMSGAALGEKETSTTDELGLLARGATIGGNCHLSTWVNSGKEKEEPIQFDCHGRVWLQEGSIGNTLHMAGAKIHFTSEKALAALDLSGSTIGGHAKLMTWQPEDGGDCKPMEIHGSETALKMVGTKIAQKLILNGATIRATRVAIDAANIEVGGKASLGTYPDRPGGDESTRYYNFRVSGQLILTSADIKLGLDMRGAVLSPASDTCVDDIQCQSELLALDLTLAHMKFLELTDPKSSQKNTPLHFRALGAVIFEHAEIDTDADLSHARFFGRMVADYARVGASLKLKGTRLWIGSALKTWHEVSEKHRSQNGEVRDLERVVAEAMGRDHAGKRIAADLSLRAAKIGGELLVDGLTARRVFNGRDDAHSSEGMAVSALHRLTIDLRGLHAEELNDNGGNGWGNSVLFWLDGFRYSRIAPLAPLAPAVLIKPAQLPKWRRAELAIKDVLKPRQRDHEVSKQRLDWLNLQYFDLKRPQTAEFTPGAYEQLGKTLRMDGLNEDAIRVWRVKIKREGAASRSRSRKVIWGLFGFLFGYGFSGKRAVATFISFVVLGWICARVADRGLPGAGNPMVKRNVPWLSSIGNVMVANHLPAVTGSEDIEQNDGGQSIEIYRTGIDLYPVITTIQPSPRRTQSCRDRIQAPLYSIETFAHVDLHQQSACSIGHDHRYWRYAQAIFSLVGWIITPLTIVTLSGVLKRHIEK